MESISNSNSLLQNSKSSPSWKAANKKFCPESSSPAETDFERSRLKYLEQRIDLLDTEFSDVRRKCDILSDQNEILILQNKKLQSQYSVLNSKVENLMKKTPSKSGSVCVGVNKSDVSKVSNNTGL